MSAPVCCQGWQICKCQLQRYAEETPQTQQHFEEPNDQWRPKTSCEVGFLFYFKCIMQGITYILKLFVKS